MNDDWGMIWFLLLIAVPIALVALMWAITTNTANIIHELRQIRAQLDSIQTDIRRVSETVKYGAELIVEQLPDKQ